MHWTSLTVELDVTVDGKNCSRCQKFKSVSEFYRQGDRLESVCKVCKQKARVERKKNGLQSPSENNGPDEQKSTDELPLPKNPRSYEDFGLTRTDFLEIVEFFQELMRLDRKVL
jgi:hypothetical protein